MRPWAMGGGLGHASAIAGAGAAQRRPRPMHMYPRAAGRERATPHPRARVPPALPELALDPAACLAFVPLVPGLWTRASAHCGSSSAGAAWARWRWRLAMTTCRWTRRARRCTSWRTRPARHTHAIPFIRFPDRIFAGSPRVCALSIRILATVWKPGLWGRSRMRMRMRMHGIGLVPTPANCANIRIFPSPSTCASVPQAFVCA